jgi:acylpyruvate hydrolase
MRLATVLTPAGLTSAAVVRGSEVALIPRASSRAGYPDIAAVFDAGERGLEDARATLSAGPFMAIEPAQFLRPVLDPGAVVCLGLNFRTNVAENKIS